jgi:hypothetical protein
MHCFADIHFYRVAPFFGEPRLDRPWLSSFDVSVGGGSTTKAHNDIQEKVALWDLYGTHPMQSLGDGVCKDFTDPLDNILIKLALMPTSPGFATFSIQGRCNIMESFLRYTQNFSKDLFIECFLPIKSLHIKNIEFIDLSPENSYPNNNDPYWLFFKQNFNTITLAHGLSIDNWQETGVGDFAALLGWAMSYQDTQEIDFVDITLQGGVTMPTSKKQNIAHAFSIPLGYNKHWGIPVHACLAIGAYEWLTVGLNLDLLFLLPKQHEEIRMKASGQQSSIILLTSGQARVHPGTLWSVAPFIKADHVARGFSLAIGYTYAHQKTTFVTPFDKSVFPYAVVNSDQRFAGFTLHTLHVAAEYDFTDNDWKYGPRVGLTYNHQMSGKQCFKTYLASITGGLEIAWDY